MAILRIRTFGDPVLRERCAEVATIDRKSVKLVKDLVETLYHVSGLGLAANQVGVVERLFVFDLGEGPVACFNPEIIFESSDTVEEEEGCLSLPNVQIPIPRPSEVEIEFTDLKGVRKRLRGEGLTARLFRHEMDHLDGGLLLERATRENRVLAMKVLNGETLE
jgi:peptide deformylase